MCDIFTDRVQGASATNQAGQGRPGHGGRRPLLHRVRRLQARDRGLRRGADRQRRQVPSASTPWPPSRPGKHVFVEKPHGIDPPGVKLMQQACDLAKEKKLCIVSGLHSRFHAGYIETVQAHPRRRHRRHRHHRGELPARALRRHRAQARVQRTGVAMQHAIPLPLALGRRRAAVAGAQPGPRELGAGQRGARSSATAWAGAPP